MAFELAINDVHAHPFSAQQGRENWKGLHNFMCRHPRLRLRKPRFPSAAKVKRFTKENVAKFFDTFEPFLRPINFSPHSSFNYNKTGLTVVQHKVCQVISLKGMRRVYFSSAEGFWADPLRLPQISSLCRSTEQDGHPSLLFMYGYRLAIVYFGVVKSGGVSSPSFLDGFRGYGLVLAVWTPLRESS